MDQSQDKQTTGSSADIIGIEPSAPAQTLSPNTPPTMDPSVLSQPPVPIKQSFLSKIGRTRLLITIGLLLIIITAVAVWFMGQNKPAATKNTAKQSTAAQSQPAKQKGVIGLVEGTVEYYDDNAWKTATTNIELEEGDELRTGANSRAVVTLDDGSAIRLDANTQIRFSSLSLTNVVIDDQNGAVYTRVTTSSQRKFTVNSNEQSYQAMGTAYRTFNQTDKQGVEVFQSTVQTSDKSDINEGQGYFTKNPDTAKVDKVTELNLGQLQNDKFLLWNKSEDEKDKEFSAKLGVLKDLKEKPTTSTAKPSADDNTAPVGSIKISAVAVTEGIRVTWSNSGVDAGSGYKIVYSSSTSAPRYGVDDAQYVSDEISAYTLALTDGKTYYIRVCTYKPSASSCEHYSSAIKVTAPNKKESGSNEITSGAISLKLTGTTLSWTFTGSAPYGFKVVYNTAGSPTYPQNDYLYLSSSTDTSADLSDLALKTGVNYIRVCKYTAGKKSQPCIDYSNQITYTKP